MSWHWPYTADQYVIVNQNGRRNGGRAMHGKKELHYLQKRVQEGVLQDMQERFGIGAAFFKDCTFNITLGGSEDTDRDTDRGLIRRLLSARPDIKETVRFCPDAQSSSYTGLFVCNQQTKLWARVHNAAIDNLLVEGFAGVPQMSTADQRYINSTRGLRELRPAFAAEVLDMEFIEKLDGNLDIFAVANGAMDLSSGRPVFRALQAQDYVSIHSGWKYSKQEAGHHRPAVEEFLARLLPLVEERRRALGRFAILLSGRRVEKGLSCAHRPSCRKQRQVGPGEAPHDVLW